MRLDFDPQPVLTNGTLKLRPLVAADLDPLHAVANDPAIWAGHPASNRHQRAEFETFFNMLITSNGALAALDANTGNIIGCSRYYTAPDHVDSISIGYTFLARKWWGGQYNFEMKRLMLDHAFDCVEAVWLHIDPTNIRSQHATAKLGAIHAYDAEIGLGGIPGLWQCWRVDKDVWARKSA